MVGQGHEKECGSPRRALINNIFFYRAEVFLSKPAYGRKWKQQVMRLKNSASPWWKR